MRRVLLLTYRSNQAGKSSFEFFDLSVAMSGKGETRKQRISWFYRNWRRVVHETGIFVVEGEKDAKVDLEVNFRPYDVKTLEVVDIGSLTTTYRFTLRNVGSHDIELKLNFGILLKLHLELADCSGIRLATPLIQQTDASESASDDVEMVDVSVDSMEGSTSTGGHSTIDIVERYICQPGTYSGDAWHIAAALLYDQDLKLVVPRPPLLAWKVDVQSVEIKDVIYWEIQLRSSLGISKYITSAYKLPQTFYCTGSLEVWMWAWRQTAQVSDHVLQFFHAWSPGTLQAGVKRTIAGKLSPDHLMTLAAYWAYDDEGLKLPESLTGESVPVQIEVETASIAEDIQELAQEPSGEFVKSNLLSLLAKIARKPVMTCLRKLLPKMQEKDLEWLLEDALLFTEHMPWRLLSQNLQRSVQRRLCSAVSGSLHRYLSGKDLEQAIEASTIESFAETAKKITDLFEKAIKGLNKSNKKAKHVAKSNQFLDFYTDCAIPNIDARTVIAFFNYNPMQGRQLFSIGRKMLRDVTLGSPLCAMTFAATSVLMNEVEQKGMGAVRKELRERFTQGLSVRSRRLIGEKVDAIGNLDGRCLILNMRRGGYHPEHDVTEGIFRQLQRFARRHDWTLICTQQPPEEWRWLSGVKQAVLDVFASPDIGEKMAIEVDMRETAYLWRCVADLTNVIGIVGGMSGSLDIAAYMGVRTFCWDIPLASREACKLENQAEYQDCIRLLLSYPFMSIGLRKIRNRVENRKLKPDEKETFTLDEIALTLWASNYDVIPKVESGYFKATKVQTLDKEGKDAFDAILFHDLSLIRNNILKADEI